jgi:hypothetical protein
LSSICVRANFQDSQAIAKPTPARKVQNQAKLLPPEVGSGSVLSAIEVNPSIANHRHIVANTNAALAANLMEICT